jgi:hypothetical protein
MTQAVMYDTYFTSETEAPLWLGFFNKLLAKNASKGVGSSLFIAGTPDISVADYLLFDLVDTCVT